MPLIIFADDDRDTTEILAVYARQRKWEVVTCATGRELLAQVKELCAEGCCPDMIVADVNYGDTLPGPRMTGISAGREIRKRFPNIPILYLTGWDSTLIRKQAREEIGAEVQSKPVKDIDAFLDRLSYLMEYAGTKYYAGPERRVESINHTRNRRRRTDVDLEVPRVINTALEKARHMTGK